MNQEHSFGYWLRLKRKSYDLTREALADRVGCSAALIRKIEAEERRPSSQIVERLAFIFDIPPDEFDSFLSFARSKLATAPQESTKLSPWNTAAIPTQSQLPSLTSSLIGRDQELQLILGYLTHPNIRLVSLLGPPGIGKTRLSLEIARLAKPSFSDGVFFATFATLEDPSLIPSAVAQALRYVETKRLSAKEQLTTGIGEKKVLLILDNCEHMIEAAATLIHDLLSSCSNLKILTTSREALRIPGEWLYSVPALGFPKESSTITPESIAEFPALALFAERARAVRSDFALTEDNIRSVASICAQLDGLPLAIELIATRVRVFPPELLLGKMTDHFILSADGMRAVTPHQKSLGNAIGWSFNTLSRDEQKILCGLSVFSGGFTLEAVEAIFSNDFAPEIVPDLVAALLEKSLLQHSYNACGEIRYQMLVTIRRFAMKNLNLAGTETGMRDRHLAYFLTFAEKGAGEMRGPAQVTWSQCLEDERNNFHAALDWAVSNQNTESAIRLLSALGWPWEIHGHYHEKRNWFDRIRSLPDLADFPLSFARLLNHVGRHSWLQGDIKDARSLLAECQAISQKIGTEGELVLAETYNWWGLILLLQENNLESAKSLFEQGLALFEKWGNQWGIALSTFHLGISELELPGDGAFRLLDKSLLMFNQFEDWFFIARVSIFIGHYYLHQARLDRARQFFEEQLRIDQGLNYWNGIAGGWVNLGNLYRQQGDFDQSSQCYEEGFALCSEHGLNEYDPAFMSGLLAMDRQDYSFAFQRFKYLLEKALKLDQPDNMGTLIAGLAAVAAGNKDLERAARLSGAAQVFRKNMGDAKSIPEYWDFSKQILEVKGQLGNETFLSYQDEGRSMSTEQIVAYAAEEIKAVGKPL